MVGWHHQLNGREFQQAAGGSEGQGSQVCCRPWGHKGLDKTQPLHNNNNKSKVMITIICFQFHVPDKKKEEKSQQTFVFD